MSNEMNQNYWYLLMLGMFLESLHMLFHRILTRKQQSWNLALGLIIQLW